MRWLLDEGERGLEAVTAGKASKSFLWDSTLKIWRRFRVAEKGQPGKDWVIPFLLPAL